MQRGRALLAALATLSAPTSGPAPDATAESPEATEEQAEEQSEPDVPASFWSQLSVVSFVPVHTSSPQEGLPWPEGSNLQPVAPPKLVSERAFFEICPLAAWRCTRSCWLGCRQHVILTTQHQPAYLHIAGLLR